MIHGAIRLCTALALVILGGCAVAPPYELPAKSETARLKVASPTETWICADGAKRSFSPDKEGYAKIRAGERVIVGVQYSAQGYNVNYSCDPSVSFMPMAGESYYQDFQVEAEKCTAFIYREVTTNPVGLDFESSLDKGGRCK